MSEVDKQLEEKTTSQATQDSKETQVQPAVEVVEAQEGAQRRVQPTVAEELPTSAEGTGAVKVMKTKGKRGGKGQASKVTEGAAPECEQLGAQDLDMTHGDHQNEDLDMTYQFIRIGHPKKRRSRLWNEMQKSAMDWMGVRS